MTTADPPGEARELLLLRHAKASRGLGPDFDRPLTDRGRRDAPRMARWMKEQGLVPDRLVASPARRTRETADLLLAELGIADATWDERVYEADVSTLLRVLAETPPAARRVLVVGHNPGLEDLVRHLAGATAREPEKGKFLPTCALARHAVACAWPELAAGSAPLVSIVSWSRRKKRWKVRGRG